MGRGATGLDTNLLVRYRAQDHVNQSLRIAIQLLETLTGDAPEQLRRHQPQASLCCRNVLVDVADLHEKWLSDF